MVQNPSYIFCAYETQKGSNSALSISSKANNNNPIYRYIQSIYRLKTELEAKEIKNIGIRMVNVPITQSMIIVDPNEEGNNNLNSEMYIEPFLFPIKEEYQQQQQQQVLYRLNPKPKDIKNDDKVKDLFDIEYLNFINLWKVAVSFDDNSDSKYLFLQHLFLFKF